jgi:serine/threonine protein kinase
MSSVTARSEEGAEFGSIQARLASMTDDELLGLVVGSAPPGVWGASGPVDLDGARVFLKRVPLTDVEASHTHSTRNHFGLPTYYSYGVGSAGFGVWRELAVHEMTDGIPGFPALLHHRVMSRTAPPGKLPWSDDEYVRYWNGNAAIREFMAARNAATQEVWIVVEYVPHPMFIWLIQNQDRVHDTLSQLFERVETLRSLGVVHFDVHFANVVTDGDACRLTDFGLAMASDFELRAPERRFLASHAHYDYGVVLGSLGLMLSTALGEEPSGKRMADLIDKIDELPVSYHAELVGAFRRYREPIAYMMGFFERARRPSKRANYDDKQLARLLRDAGVPIP